MLKAKSSTSTARWQRRATHRHPHGIEPRSALLAYWIAPQRLLKLPVGTVGVAPLIRLAPLAADWRVGVWAACTAGAGVSSAGSCGCGCADGLARVTAGAVCGLAAGFGGGSAVTGLCA